MASLLPAAVAAEQATVLQLIADSQTTNYLAAANLALLILEHISTFEEEVKYVWQSRLSLWSVLYVVVCGRPDERMTFLTQIRYFTLISLGMDVRFMFRPMKTSERCQQYLLAQLATSTTIMFSVDCILILRVWLLFGKGKKLLVILIALLIVETACMTTFGLLAILPLKDFADVGPFLNECYSLEVPRLITFYPLAPFLMSILL
ncbi:hypothetical protein FB45DRAFT_1049985, partial [Roridomyces roridus]